MLPESSIPKVDAKDVNVLVALPCYGGVTHVSHNGSMRALEKTFSAAGIRYQISETVSESLIPRARNAFANMVLFDKDPAGNDYTHLLFLDVDIGFDPINIVQMIGWDKDIVGLPYPCKAINWEWVSQAVRKGITDPNALSRMGSRPIINTNGTEIQFNCSEPVQFPQLGTGLMLVKRHVLQKFSEDPERNYKLMVNEKTRPDRDYAVDFFRIGVNPKTRYYDSEDYRFCLDAREMGFETWLLPWAVSTHTGPHTFTIDMVAQAVHGIPDLSSKTGFAPATI